MPAPPLRTLRLEDRPGLPVDRKATEGDAKRKTARLKFAAPRRAATAEDPDLRPPRGIDRSVMAQLIDGDRIDRRKTLPSTGQTGPGKSRIACTLGQKACRDGRNAACRRAARLFKARVPARGDGRHARLLQAIATLDVLLLDDRGKSVRTPSARRDLLEILEDRNGRAPTIATGQTPVEHGHKAIGDPASADAIFDRTVHDAHRLQLSAGSMRRNTAQPLDCGHHA